MTQQLDAAGSRSVSSTLGGHPKGLYVLFFTEMWERFSFYGMRALLMLYMLEVLHYNVAAAANVYGIYQGGVYLTPLWGGYLADRYWGQRRAIVLGSALMALGHFTLCFSSTSMFYAALGLLIVGNGFFKPNISVLVGKLYAPDDPRRDGAFSIFYMGINLGAFLAPLLCGALGQRFAWHWGFAAAGFGMLLGMLIYLLGQRHLGVHGLPPSRPAAPQTAVSLPWWRWQLTPVEAQRLAALLVLALVGNTLFQVVFEQAGSSMALFAATATDLHVLPGSQLVIPSSWLQAVNPLFIGLLAPLFSLLWLRLARQAREPSIPSKFAIGMLLMAASFAVLVLAGQHYDKTAQPVSMAWLIGAFLFGTCGELCLSPVGLAAVTRLAPSRFASQVMGLWFASMALGNWLSGQLAGTYASMSKALFFSFPLAIALLSALALLLLQRPLRAWMH